MATEEIRSRPSEPLRPSGLALAILLPVSFLALIATSCDRSASDRSGTGHDGAKPPASSSAADGAAGVESSSQRGAAGSEADGLPVGSAGLTYSPDAQFRTYQALRADLDTPKHAADGAGRAFLDLPPGAPNPPRVYAGERSKFDVVFEAGPLGVAEGGMVFLQPSPFWGWDPPQAEYSEAPGFTEVSTDADGVTLRAEVPESGLLAVHVEGRALRAGERIRFVYGSGDTGARVDRYAETESKLWVAVDGDGDGVRGIVRDSPAVDVLARPPSRLIVTLPTTAKPGEVARLTIALLDGFGNAGFPFEGAVELQVPDGMTLPAVVTFTKEDAGRRSIEAKPERPGVFRVRARAKARAEEPPSDAAAQGDPMEEEGVLEAESNPLVVSAEARRILWGDLHGHSGLSDGTGTPDEYFTYARDVSSLDVAVLTDHDHWGIRFLDQNPDLWKRIENAVVAFHEPKRFVTMLGYEWTSWLQGHRHVLYFDDKGDICSSMDPDCQTPDQLWRSLEGKPALTFAHHSAGGPVGTNWEFAPDPRFEPVTEVVSVHGSSEAWDSPRRIYNPQRGNFVRDALGRGYQLGFIGSGDSHDGHPGLAQIASGSGDGGLAAIMSEDLTREGVLEALRARRVYATSGVRMLLRVRLSGHEMGSILDASQATDARLLDVRVAAPTPIERVDLVRGRAGGESAVQTVEVGGGLREWSERFDVQPLAAGEFLYVRVVLVRGDAAWSSPFYGAVAKPD